MSYGFKVFNCVEDAEKEFGGVRSFYEAKEVDDYIRVMKAENRRLQHQYNQAVLAANENIANKVENWGKVGALGNIGLIILNIINLIINIMR